MSETLKARINPIRKIFFNKKPKSYTAGLLPYRNKNWQEALQLFELATTEQPDHSDSHFKLGMCHFRQKNYEQAKEAITKAMLLSPERDEWKKQLAQTERHLSKKESKGTLAEREEIIRNQLEEDEHNAELYDQLAQVLRKQGKWWQEVEALKKATALVQNNENWFYRLGEALEVMNRFQQAAEAYATAIALSNDKADAQWYYRLGYCYEREGHDGPAKPDAADKAYKEAIAKDTKLNAQRFGIGVFHQARGHWVQAQQAYAKQLENKPLDAELNYRLGMAHDRCYNWAEAAKYYKQAITIDVNKPHWHYRLGFVLERSANYHEAELAYEYAAKNHHKHTPYWFYRWGYVLEKQEKYAEATAAYLQTRIQQALYAPVTSEDERLNNYTQQFDQQFIIDKLLYLLEQDTTVAEHWYQLGNAYEQQSHFQKATDAYKHAIARKNDHLPEWYYRLGYTLSRLENFKEACSALKNTRILQGSYGVPEEKFNKTPDYRQSVKFVEYYENLPINKNTVLYESFHGANMGCNPSALFEYLLNSAEYRHWTHIWVINDNKKISNRYKSLKNVIFIKRQSDAYLRALSQSEYLINNVSFPEYFIRKEEQTYLNTWHGTPIKYLGKDIKDDLLAHKNVARNFLQASHLLNPNSHTTNILLERYDVSNLYSGHVAELGYPRIDRTINLSEERKIDIRSYFTNEHDKKLVLYAPTWRGEHGKAKFNTTKLKEDLIELSSSEYIILFRGHHMVESLIGELDIDGVEVVPEDFETNELLGTVDLLITDYSSIAFDFFVTKKPIIYYAYDLELYQQERGLYFPLEDLPGFVVDNIEDLHTTIKNYLNTSDDLVFDDAILKYCPHDDGNVSKRTWDWLFGETPEKNIEWDALHKKSLLFYNGPFLPNGILTSWTNLVENIDQNEYSISLVVDANSIKADNTRIEQYDKKPSHVQVLGYCGRRSETIEESWLNDKFNSQQYLASAEMYEKYHLANKREFLRLFGRNKINSAIHFEGYNKKWVSVFSGAVNKDIKMNAVYQHNHKMNEWIYRFPYLEGVFNHYQWFDKVVSVSEKTGELNKNELAKRFSIPEEKMIFCDNVQNPERVIEKAALSCQYLEKEKWLHDGSQVFITLGRLSPEKDHQKLIKAFVEVQKEKENIKLLILGDGPLKSELQALIKGLDASNFIKLMGRIDNPFPLLKAADCFVLSSNHEGQPMVLFEAMILGKPIIATDIVGSRSALEGRPGLLVNNSESGLIEGFRRHISKEISIEKFDIDSYQNKALSSFYSKVCLK